MAPEAGIKEPHLDAGEPTSHLAFLKRTNQGLVRVLEERTRKRSNNRSDLLVRVSSITK